MSTADGGGGLLALRDALRAAAPRGLLNVIFTCVSAGFAAVGAVQAAAGSGYWLATAVVGAVLAVLLPGWLAWAERAGRLTAEEYARELQTDLQVTTGKVLAPVAQRLAELQCEPDVQRQHSLRGEARTHILDAVLELSQCPQARVSLYKLGPAAPPANRELTLVRSLGRQDVPRQAFTAGDVRHPDVLDTIEQRQAVLVQDVLQLNSQHYSGRSYRTFAAAPIYAGDTALGLLAVDSPEADSIPPSFTGPLMALASMLAMAMDR